MVYRARVANKCVTCSVNRMRPPTLLYISLECQLARVTTCEEGPTNCIGNVVVAAAGVSVDVHVIGKHGESMRLPLVDPHIWVSSHPCHVSRKVVGYYDNY
jgi:hypothetical protein